MTKSTPMERMAAAHAANADKQARERTAVNVTPMAGAVPVDPPTIP